MTACPECGAPAFVEDRGTATVTEGAHVVAADDLVSVDFERLGVQIVRLRCVAGHWLQFLAEEMP